ncbi:MAG: carbohydrate ABC transporter permease [Phycisphaerae bacterium]|jgi:multiple sugar transport system permease protein/fructooligosaccharide transport system permease protein
MSRGRRMAIRWAAALVAVVVAVLYLTPILWTAAASLKPDEFIHRDVDSLRSLVPGPTTPDNYAAAERRGQVSVTLVNTFIVVVVIAAGGLLINAPAAYAFARMRFPGRDALFLAFVGTIIVPLEAIVIPLFVTVQGSRGLESVLGERTWTLVALSVPFLAKAFNVFLLRQAFLSLPRALEEAAFIDGAGWWRAFWRVGLPNVRPALVTVVLLDFVIHWNDFLWPLVICQDESTRTVQIGLGAFFTQPPVSWGAILAYAVLITLPVLLVFAVGQRWIVRSLAATGVRE